jgi:hypothetical protein
VPRLPDSSSTLTQSAPGRRSEFSTFKWLFIAAFIAVAYYAIFRLPFHFPPKTRMVSASYIFGFNNAVSVASIVLLLGAAALVRLWRRRNTRGESPALAFTNDDAPDRARIPLRVFALVALVYIGFTVFLYAVARTSTWYRIDFEASHFLWRLRLMESYGLRPYLDFQFEYGPALLYPVAFLHSVLLPAGVSLEASYYACHVALNLLGLLAIFFLLNHAPTMARNRKVIAFFLLGIAALTPFMGLNGVVLRFLFPYLSVVVAHREANRPRAAVWTFVSVFILAAVNILLSPEVGLAFAIAWIMYCAFLSRRNPGIAFVGMLALIIAAGACAVTLPREYFGSVFRFSAGANNFPVLPAAHILFYVLTLFLLVPALLADALRRQGADGAILFSMCALCVVTIPAALGRCDPPHVMTYGLGVALILFVRLANQSAARFGLYAGAYATVVIGGMFIYEARRAGLTIESFFPGNIAGAIRRGGDEPTARELSALDKYPSLGLPFGSYGADKRTQAYLFSHSKLAPEYYCGVIGVYTETELSRKLDDLSRLDYVIVPKGWQQPWKRDVCADQLGLIRDSFMYPAQLQCKKEGLDGDLAVNHAIAGDFSILEEVGNSVVMKRVSRRR